MTGENEDKIKIIPLGGLGAIGCHLTVFEYRNEILIVDVGIMFPDEEMPGVDFLIPDFTYIIQNKWKVRGIVITHGHEDHIGALSFLLQNITAPVYATRLTLGFIKSRLEERPPREEAQLIEVAPRDRVSIGAFTVEFIKVNHSIADGVGLAINTDEGTIIHTGDFKVDYSPLDGQVIDLSRFSEYGDQGVLLLMSDSTNAVVEGHSRSETSLMGGLSDIFSSSKGRIIVACFASNIHRIQQVLDAAHRYNRKVAFSGSTVQKNFEIASNLGYLTVRDELIIDIKKASGLPDKKVVVICTGSQGEPMSALSRMANGTHKQIMIGAKDTVMITASIIPGKEKTVNNVVNSLLKLGAEVYYDQEDIHATGHAPQEELKLMISLVKPRFFMPIHGEYRHLTAHARIAESLKMKSSRIIVAENGDILELSGKGFVKTGVLKLSRVFVDGNEIGDIESEIIKDRQTMSTEGVVFISALISGETVWKPVNMTVKGFANRKKDVLDAIQELAGNDLEKILSEGIEENEIIPELRKKLKKYIFGLTRRYPIIEIQLIRM